MQIILNTQTLNLLTTLYSEPGRYYHNINHIKYMLARAMEWAEATNATFDDSMLLQHGIWWHDAVYSVHDRRKGGNENESARLFLSHYNDIGKIQYFNSYVNVYMKTEIDAVNAIQNMIKATAHHLDDVEDAMVQMGVTNNKVIELTKVLMDIDLSVFGDSYDLVSDNSADIQHEYAATGISDEDYLRNRLTFLQTLLAKDRIFYTDYFHERYEKNARDNIRRSINSTQNSLNLLLGHKSPITFLTDLDDPKEEIREPTPADTYMAKIVERRSCVKILPPGKLSDDHLGTYRHRNSGLLCEVFRGVGHRYRVDFHDGVLHYTDEIDHLEPAYESQR